MPVSMKLLREKSEVCKEYCLFGKTYWGVIFSSCRQHTEGCLLPRSINKSL
jgi:hypothetical protein